MRRKGPCNLPHLFLQSAVAYCPSSHLDPSTPSPFADAVLLDTMLINHFAASLSSLIYPLQEKYKFKALNFHAKGFANKAEFKAKHGSDLYLVDIDQYDSICKVFAGLAWRET